MNKVMLLVTHLSVGELNGGGSRIAFHNSSFGLKWQSLSKMIL